MEGPEGEKKVCTFFGHRDTPEWVRTPLKEAVIKLIETEGVREFYVGHQGSFDRMALSVLRELEGRYPEIRYYVVLAYLPGPKREDGLDYTHTLYPEGLETVPKRFAISRRNRWMAQRAGFAVTYIIHQQGGAAQFAGYIKRRKKWVVNLAEQEISG